MDAILPFLVGPALAVWDTQAGRACLAGVVRLVASCGAVRTVRVVTDRPELFVGLPAAVICAAQPTDGLEPGALPRNARWAMAALAANGTEISGPVLVADPRNPFLTTALLEAALERFAASGQPLLLGAVAPEDHPCQFTTPTTVTDAGLLLLFEAQPEALPWLPQGWAGRVVVTWPLAFDWEAAGVPGAVTFHAAGPLGLPVRGAPAVVPAAPPTEPLWVRQDHATARIVLDRKALAGRFDLAAAAVDHLAGANLLRQPGDSLLVARPGGPGALLVSCRRPGSAPALLRLTPFGPAGSVPARAAAWPLGEADVELETPWRPGEDAGFVATVQEHDPEQTLSCPQPFIPEAGLWRYDVTRGVRVNTATDRPIVGRQHFPDLLRLDGSLAVGAAKDLARADELLREGRVALHVLEHEWSFQDDRLALAQRQAMAAQATDAQATGGQEGGA